MASERRKHCGGRVLAGARKPNHDAPQHQGKLSVMVRSWEASLLALPTITALSR